MPSITAVGQSAEAAVVSAAPLVSCRTGFVHEVGASMREYPLDEALHPPLGRISDACGGAGRSGRHTGKTP